jgi:ferredoxin-NADP reductase/predicted pyridoxine 5'-phosphate oxidase superfamily flavin-nucleotide-binding protein
MTPTSPFHSGEQEIQRRLGVRDEIEPWARRVVRPELPEQHRSFYAERPFLVVAARDAAGLPWATLLAAEPGFAHSPDPSALRIEARPAAGDALADALQPGDDVGVLGIELHTRRRNRANGRVSARHDAGLTLAVEQSFGNCPQYITARRWRRAPAASAPGFVVHGMQLGWAEAELITIADTFFIATGFRGEGESPVFGMDASHRGGSPGFVRVESSRELVFPDYAGNDHFNTLGNLLLDPRAGLLFVDFERGDLLQLTGTAEIEWEPADLRGFPGAKRLVRFRIDRLRRIDRALPLRFESAANGVRELRVVAKQPESADVTSFVFAARDGRALPAFLPGQHLPLELEISGEAAPVQRTYSLSGPPGAPVYRISVKRESLGLASRALHDTLEVGAFVAASPPQGDFTLDAESTRPVVLVSAGVGLTPLVSMLHALARADSERAVWFVHGARDGAHHPLRREVEQLVAGSPRTALHVAYSRPAPGDRAGRDYASVGRIDAALLEKLVPGLDADFYLCGPRGFMASIEGALVARGVPASRIRSESFGPAAG